MEKSFFLDMSEIERRESLAKEIMEEENLKGKAVLTKLNEIVEAIGDDKEAIKEAYSAFKEKEDYANSIMSELDIKGKATRIKVMRIMDTVGRDKQKIKNRLLRSTIASRIEHD
ncbi:MAG: hypothetical protein EU539_05505 [Promethearchaeota archaeon]|nr:MAG: hypothetical protein EU539_05505 [Candidatus Lokiarchaeota archaeon]